jgi:Effector Associated Constant Component 1
MTLEIRICAEGEGSEEALVSLHDWLSQDPDVRCGTVLRLEAPGAVEGTMSASFDAIMAIVSNGIALGSLIVAYQSWRDASVRSPKIMIETEDVRIDLTDSSQGTVIQIVKDLSKDAGV